MPQFTYITWTQLKGQLAARLADPSNVFWTDAELGMYLIESLRVWSALTEQWNQEFTFNATSASQWYNLGTMNGSPRKRSVTDANLYTSMQYMLLEPATGAGPWTGTSQFSLSDLQNALQRRRDELIQVSGCNMTEQTLAASAGSSRIYFPDNTLEPRRARFIPANAAIDPNVLNLEDRSAMMYFEDDNPTAPAGVPDLWSVVSGPPLAMDVDRKMIPGNFKVISLVSGSAFAPPAATLMGLPDDWAWVAMYGALADLLGRESEATDRLRAEYCLKRYEDGMKLMAAANWMTAALINNQNVDTPSLAEVDCYAPDWETSATTWPMVVAAGVDFVAPAPLQVGGGVLGVEVNLVGNAPIPANDDDFVQVSRDALDVILDYAQATACFKQGGADFIATLPMLSNFFTMAQMQNKRMEQLALYWTTFRSQGTRQTDMQPRS